MNNHNFIVPIVDTDSITICKYDGAEFTKEELTSLTEEINTLIGGQIHWELEFYIPTIIAVKAKNYILDYGKGKVVIKGSGLKASMKEKKLKTFITEIIKLLLADRQVDIPILYNNYAKEILNIKDMTGWALKRTITASVINPERTNEQKVLDALEGEEQISQGDKYYFYFAKDKSLKLVNKFDPANPDYCHDTLYEKLYKTIKIFESILPMDNILNYKLKRNKKALDQLALS